MEITFSQLVGGSTFHCMVNNYVTCMRFNIEPGNLIAMKTPTEFDNVVGKYTSTTLTTKLKYHPIGFYYQVNETGPIMPKDFPYIVWVFDTAYELAFGDMFDDYGNLLQQLAEAFF